MLGALLLAQSADAQPAAALAGLDAFIAKSMTDWSVPGASVAIVNNDRVVYLKGFGTRRIGEAAKVDSQTVFAIGSATKAFTAAAIAMLVDDNRIKWDEPVTRYLPNLRLPTPALTAQVTVRDVLSHRTGLGDNVPLFWGTQRGAAELLSGLSSLPVHAGIRERFEYNNLMYVVAGELVAQVSGKPWAEFVAERLLRPLGMANTAPDATRLTHSVNVAAGHSQNRAGAVTAAPLVNLTNVAPAGGMFSNAADMAQWVRFQLGDGTFGDAQIVSRDAVNEMRSPHIFIPPNAPFAPFFAQNVFAAYGLGWMSSDYNGHLLVQHAGSTDAMTSLVAFMPDQKLGVIVLTNRGGQWMPSAVLYRVLDAYLGARRRDWSTEYRRRVK